MNNTPTSGAEQAGHQVIVRLSGQPGEVLFVDFRSKPNFAPPTEVPTPSEVPPTPTPAPGPYDGQWAGTLSGKTAGNQDFNGHFRIEVRANAIYRVALDGPSCAFETLPNFPNGQPINGDSFGLSGSPTNPKLGTDSSINYAINGAFSSTSKASGQINATQNGGSCIVGSWSVTKQ